MPAIFDSSIFDGTTFDVGEATAIGSSSLNQLAANGVGQADFVATGTPNINQLTANGVASGGSYNLSGAPTLSQLTVSSSGIAHYPATGTSNLSQLTASASALMAANGAQGNPNLLKLTVSAIAVLVRSASGAPTLSQLTAHGVGSPYTAVRRNIGITFYTPATYGVFVHEPWWPHPRIRDLTHKAMNINRDYERMAAGHATIDLPALDENDHTIHQGNILTIVSNDQPAWVGPIFTLSDSMRSGVTNLHALGIASIMGKRIAPQHERYTMPVSSTLVFRSLISKMNARGHTGIFLPDQLEVGPTVGAGFFVGGQTILQALESLHNETNWEWWLTTEVTPAYIRTVIHWGYKQGHDLSAHVHLWHGQHLVDVELTHDLSEGKQVTTTYGGFGRPMWERKAMTQVANVALAYDVGGIAQQLAPELVVRDIMELPASLRDERARIDVTTESANALARESAKEQDRRLARETSIKVIAANIDRSALEVGNYVTIHAPIGHHRELSGAVRIVGVQPDEELGQTEFIAEVRV